MLRLNSVGHALMQRSQPDAEKQKVVVLHEADDDRWLDAAQDDMHTFLQRCPADSLVAEPAPRPPTKRAAEAAELRGARAWIAALYEFASRDARGESVAS